MNKLLSGKTAIITGTNRGIGKAILDRFAKNGCKEIFAVIRKENVEFMEYIKEVSEKEGCIINVIYADFSDMESVKNAARDIVLRVREKKTNIDFLINNVGANYLQDTLAMTRIDKIVETLQVNLISHLYFTQIISRRMTQNDGGSIVFMSSAAAFDGGGNVAYVASKAAICGVVKRLAIEYNDSGIRVNAIAPGVTDTDMVSILTDDDEKIAMGMQIMKRKGRPEEIADVAVFLASSMSSFITGQVIHADGGVR